MGSQKQEDEWEPTKGSSSFRMSMAYLAPKCTKNLKCKQVWPTINFDCQVIESAFKETDRYKGGTLPSHDSGGWWKDYFSLVGLGGMVPWLHHDHYVFVASLSHLIDTCLQLGLFSDATCYQRCQDTVHSKRCVTAVVLTISWCCSSNWSISKLQISDDGWNPTKQSIMILHAINKTIHFRKLSMSKFPFAHCEHSEVMFMWVVYRCNKPPTP